MKTTRIHQIAAASVAVLSAAFIGVSDKQGVRVLGSYGIVGGLGYLAAATLLEDEMEALRARLELSQDAASSAESKAKKITNQHGTKLSSLQLLRKQLEEQYSLKEQDLLAEYKRKEDSVEERVRVLKEQLAKSSNDDYLSKVKKLKSVHINRQRQLHDEIDRLSETLERRETQLKEEFYKNIEPYESLYQEYDKVVKEIEDKVSAVGIEFSTREATLLEERDRLYQELREYRNPAPFRGSTKADIIGNKLLSFFLRKGITLDAERCEATVNQSIVWVRPRATTLDTVEQYAEEIELFFELVSTPKLSIDHGCIRLTLTDADIAEKVTIAEPDLERFMDALQASNHIRITAPTDTGKSVLLDNILSFYQRMYDGLLKVSLSDPKYPFTPWGTYQPQHKGFDESLSALAQVSNIIKGRIDTARQLADAGLELPDYEPELYAIDELEALYDEAIERDDGKKGEITKALIRSMNMGLKVGRGLTKVKGRGIKMLYVTQSPLCSRIGLNKDAFDQSTSIYLGSNIAIALQDNGELQGKITDIKRRALQKEYSLRIANGQKYLMMVRLPNGGDVFLMKAPKPISAPEITCTHCSSTKHVKNGLSNGVQRYLCKSCNKSFVPLPSGEKAIST